MAGDPHSCLDAALMLTAPQMCGEGHVEALQEDRIGFPQLLSWLFQNSKCGSLERITYIKLFTGDALQL